MRLNTTAKSSEFSTAAVHLKFPDLLDASIRDGTLPAADRDSYPKWVRERANHSSIVLKCSEVGLGTVIGQKHSSGRAGKLLRWLLRDVPAADALWSKCMRGAGEDRNAPNHAWLIF